MFTSKVVPVDGLEGRFVRKWSGADYMEWEDALQEHKLANGQVAVGSVKATCVALSLCDENGKRTVKGRSANDLKALLHGMERDEVDLIFKAASELNGVLTKVDQIEVAEGN